MSTALLTNWMLFAEGAAGGRAPGSLIDFLFPLTPWLGIGFLFYFLLIRPQRREQTKRQAMLAALKKNDRVITSAGIYGVVTNVHAEADKVILKVDETGNVKIPFTLSSIVRVLEDEPSNDKSK